MENPSDGLLIQRAVYQLTPDVFQHPVWVRFAAAAFPNLPWSTQPLLNAAKMLQAGRDSTGASAVLFLCAASQAAGRDYPAALGSIDRVLKQARRFHLPGVEYCAYWAAAAICVQMGAFDRAAGNLLLLQRELSRAGEWILADLIELVRQSLGECAGPSSPPGGVLPRPAAQDKTRLLIEQLLCWGQPPATGAQAGASQLVLLGPGTEEMDGPRQDRGWRLLWGRLRRLLGGAPPEGLHLSSPSNPAPHLDAPAAWPAAPRPVVPVTAIQPGNLLPGPQELPARENPPSPGNEPAEPARTRLPALPEMAPAPTLSAYLMGSFRITLGDTMIETWPSGRSQAVFAYMLDHHARPVPRETLIEAFWPDIRLDSARNSLNVAVYTLRKTLKNLLDAPVILSNEAAYQINPDLHLWVDVEAFEQHVIDAQNLEASGAFDDAAYEYKLAVSLYLGDFLADTPYEDWTTLKRERLRVLYLETLDHLSMIFFNQGDYDACIGLCQRILSHDACREDAHCRLMRCFTRQGQVHLALRQYQACVEILRSELDVAPSPATVQLCRQIKKQESV